MVFNLAGQIDSQGILNQDFQDQETDPTDDQFITRLDIKQGTRALDKEGKAIQSITLTRVATPEYLQSEKSVIALFECSPDGTIFSQPVTLTIKYDPSLLPEEISEKDLTIACYNTQKESWEYVSSLVDPESHIITANLNHFSIYAIAVKEASFISWSSFILIVGIELAIGLVVVFNILHRRRLKLAMALSGDANEDSDLVPLSPIHVNEQMALPPGEVQVPDKEPEPVQSIEIENDNDCNEIILTLEKDESSDEIKLPLKVTLKKNPGLSTEKTIKVQIIKKTKNN
jgi:hypothetical protein